jgi:hypothetical protein
MSEIRLRKCGCLEDGRSCAKACGMDMTGWQCDKEVASREQAGEQEHPDFEQVYAGKKGTDARIEVSRLTCKVCGGFQEGCTCDPEPPAQPDAGRDVVERMYKVFNRSRVGWTDENKYALSINAMTAAYQVAIAERDAQWEKAICEETPIKLTVEDIDKLIKVIRARLAQDDKPRTPAERVTIENRYHDQTNNAWIVMLDGAYVFGGNSGMGIRRKDAERYAAGLRAELEKQ